MWHIGMRKGHKIRIVFRNVIDERACEKASYKWSNDIKTNLRKTGTVTRIWIELQLT